MRRTGLLAAGLALAQTYPSRPVHFVVPFAAGGGSDVMARLIAEPLSQRWGQQVVVDNKPGAGGNIGMDLGAKAPADGYTLFLTSTSTIAINPTLYGNLPFDPLKDLTPVSLIGEVPNVLAVPVDRPYRSVAEIIAAAKARPEALNFGSSGIGSAGHLAAEQLNLMAGIRTTHVPYRGGGALLPELIAGRVDYAFTTALNGIPQAEAGKLRILGVPNGKRVPLLPEIPTIAESGLPGFDGVDWAAMMAPPNLPAPILAKLNATMQSVLKDPELVQAMAARRLVLEGSTPEALAEFLRRETARWAPVVRASGARPD